MVIKPRVAIAVIGAGLAGALLAEELKKWADVTVFERGHAFPTNPVRPIINGHPLGLYPSYGYGLGGTTNLWHGGLLAMRPEEYGGHWPTEVKNDLKRYQPAVVGRLYGDAWLRIWEMLGSADAGESPVLDVIVKPSEPFRVRRSSCFSHVNLRLCHHIQRVEEVGDKVTVYAESAAGTEPFVFDLAVISAGGMNSPLILRRSNIGGRSVGDNITDHPMGFVAKVSRGVDHTGFERFHNLPETENMLKIYDAESALWSAFYLRPTANADITSDPYADSFKTLGSFGRVRKYSATMMKRASSKFRRQATSDPLRRPQLGAHAYVLVVSEQEARGQGSVREDATGVPTINWVVSDAVVSAIHRSLDRLADWLGAKLHRAPGNMHDRLWAAAHHSGGCRIGNDPSMAVVDSNLKAHGTKRIFVCDGSVLPSTGATNTGLTIGALALRLAAHLTRQNAPVHRPAPRRALPRVLISGATGHLQRMIEPALARGGIDTRALDGRAASHTSLGEKSSILIQLANVSGAWEENAKLQQTTADAVSASGIRHAIVPMSFATLDAPTRKAGDSNAFNLGFKVTTQNSYILGKLKSEEIWLKWQKDVPGRRLDLVYIATVLGPNSNWTQCVAGYRPGMTIWVPRIPQFFFVDEGHLSQLIATLCQAPGPPGVGRHVAVSQCGSLAEAIASDRGRETVREFTLPIGLRWLISLTKQNEKASAALRSGVKLIDRSLRLAAEHALLPLEPEYYRLFFAQSCWDRKTVLPNTHGGPRGTCEGSEKRPDECRPLKG